MNYDEAQKIVQETFENDFNEARFSYFIRNLLDIEVKPFPRPRAGAYIPTPFSDQVKKYQRIGKYIDPQGQVMDVLVVYLKRETALERARVSQRNFIAWYLNKFDKDAALAAFQTDESTEWRFSFVCLSSSLDSSTGKNRIKKELTEARRYSFLVGSNEPSHTAQQHLIPLLMGDEKRPNIKTIEEAFSIERVTDQFFLEYKQLFEKISAELERMVKRDDAIRQEFESKEVNCGDFAKKLLGQLVFLYFLQKKGWLGVGRDETGQPADWGSGPRDFLYHLFEKRNYHNFFNDILEPLFYYTLAVDRRKEQDWCMLDCRIPFLNGGLFEPIKNYDWENIDILLPNSLFAEIFTVFDRYNFTVKEDEPLEKEVAVDPEMLGKVFERLLDSADQKAKGAFYTPRQIVHYICQQCLINYLARNLAGKIAYDDIIYLVRWAEHFQEINQAVIAGNLKADNRDYRDFMLPESIVQHAAIVDKLLADIKICDPAIGSGAFPVGMMQEIVRVRGILTKYLKDEQKRTPYYFKRHAIETSLYGVDIDASAVDIAKLRLWLSLVVDEENVKNISPLPNLDYKIMQGDSLLENYKGITLYDQELAVQTVVNLEEEIMQLETRIKERSADYLTTFKQKRPDKQQQQDIREELEHYNKKLKDLKSLLKGGQKAVVGNLAFEGLGDSSRSKKEQLQQKRAQLFNATDKAEKDKLKIQIEDLVWDFIRSTLKEQGKEELVKEVEQYRLSNHRPFMLWRLHFDEVFDRDNGGFDVVIGNPPYVSNKMVDKEFQAYYRAVYGMADDLYNYFFVKAFDIARNGGIVAYISSNTYFTIQTKQNLRRLFQDNRVLEIIKTENVFQNAMVEPAIIIMVKENMREQDYELAFKDAVDDFDTPNTYTINVNTYRHALNQVFFPPTTLNLQVYNKYNQDLRTLLEQWWDKISSSKKIAEHSGELEVYRQSLRAGDVTLLGLLTDGGQGLATADNGRFVGVIAGSTTATRTIQTRPEKLLAAINKHQIRGLQHITNLNEARDYLASLEELEIRQLFDKLKTRYGRDIFGQGYLYKVISPAEIAEVDKLSDKEKKNGIAPNKPNFVPYDKGDKEGNRWYLETPFYIDWSEPSVSWLKSNSGKKEKGMPVVRNAKFYFKEGFCWSDIHTVLIKSRLKGKGVYDVKSMSLFSLCEQTPDWFLVCILNSTFISNYSFDFINNTQTLQINDARQLPIIIPSKQQLQNFKNLFDQAYDIKIRQFSGQLPEPQALQELEQVQARLDKMVYHLYGIEDA